MLSTRPSPKLWSKCTTGMSSPGERIGISRRQWGLIDRFIVNPADFPPVTMDEEPTIHEHQGHIGY